MRHRVPCLAFLAFVSFAMPAAAQVGAPLVGLPANVSANFLHLSWTGTDADPGHESELLMLGGLSLLQGTAPAGTYFVRVHARNDFGVSGPSNEVQITVAGCAGMASRAGEPSRCWLVFSATTRPARVLPLPP